MRAVWQLPTFIVALLLAAAVLGGESITFVNQTGGSIELIRVDPAGDGQWGDNLIPDAVVKDNESVVLDLMGLAPWSFFVRDIRGDLYVLHDANDQGTGKIAVEPEDSTRLSHVAGVSRKVRISNRTGQTITSVRISGLTDDNWGKDVLLSRNIRNGETVSILLDDARGTLNFDIRFTLLSEDSELFYEKTEVILPDGASLVLESKQS